jgi:hypothetical protein
MPWRLLLGIAGLLVLATANADERAKDAKAVIKRAIAARGGAALLRKYPAATWKVEGTSFAPGRKATFEGEWSVQPPERVRLQITGEERGQRFTRLLVIAGDKGWTKVDDVVEELDGATLAEERQRLYANWIASLVPLIDGDFELSLVEDKRIGQHVCVGVKVAQDGRRDVRLYFDREKYALLQMETTIHELQTGRDVVQHVRFHYDEEHKQIQGIQQATRFTVRWDNRKHAEGKYSDFKFLETIPAKQFAKP